MGSDIQQMINEHEDVTDEQHRLVRWRHIGDCVATIWVSCYTKDTLEGIRLGSWTATQQSVLERCSAIVYKHKCQFASSVDRYPHSEENVHNETFAKTLFQTFSSAREDQLDSRETVLRSRERDLKKRERDLELETASQVQRTKDISQAADKLKGLLANASARMEAALTPPEQR